MSPISIRLSFEELAVVLYQTGMKERADELIESHFGSIPREEMAARLVTASNSLMARELLEPDILINKLDISLQRIGQVVGNPDFYVHCSRNALWNVTEISYHFADGLILENKILLKVLHEINELSGIDKAIQNQVDFIEMNKAEKFSCPTAFIPNLALSEFLDVKKNIPINERLKDTELCGTIPEDTRKMFGEDWTNSQYWGLYLRYEQGSPPAFDRGFMILRGEKRFWLMKPVQQAGEYKMEVMPAVQSIFEKELKDLLAAD